MLNKIKKMNFGIDAPLLIIFFMIFGFALISFGLILSSQLKNISLHWAHFFIYWGWSNIILIIMAVFMIFSSRYGKIKIISQLINSLNLRGNEKILDVGCGRGLFMISAASFLVKGGYAAGIDIWSKKDLSGNTKKMTLSHAKLHNAEKNVIIKTNDMRQIEFKSSLFDFVFSGLAVHNLPSSQDREAAIREMVRVLKPGGKIILLDFKFMHDYHSLLAKLNVTDLQMSKRKYLMFPPVRILSGEKCP